MAAIALVDCNNFYCSCEQLFAARLHDKPLVVLSNNDGCVIARNDQAKSLSIAMGAPLFKIWDTLEEQQVEWLSSNYELYGDLSQRVMATLADFTPDIEYYSIDEAFLGLTPTRQQTLTDLGRAIQQRVKRHVGIPVSVGIAETKTLAKIATYHAKRSKTKTQGVLDLTASPYQELALAKTPVEEVWGVGWRYAEMLGRHGIQTALDLRNAPDDFIRQQMSVVGLRTVHELRGIRCLPLELVNATRKSITVSRSFGSAVTTLEDLRAALALYVSRAAEKLRKEDLVAGVLTTFIETNRFRPTPQYNGSLTLDIAPFSNLTPELQALTLQALAAIYRPGYQYKRTGVLLTNLVPAQTVTRRLWEDERNEQLRQVMSAMDAINAKFGRDTVRWGAFARQGLWPTKFGRRSPRYTTRWTELMTVGSLAEPR